MDRRGKLLAGLDPSHLQGAEIGPLASPIVSRDQGRIFYIDHIDAAGLRRKYKDHDGVDQDAIVEIDAVWGENTVRDALGPDMAVDYVIASHVVEHVPDLVTWLDELASVLKPGGSIRLAVPDRRFCFDYHREASRLADVLAAHLARARRPQAREVIDFALHHAHLDLQAAWDGAAPVPAPPEPDRLSHAFDLARRALGGEYVDVHCWTFTLGSFARIMRDLGRLGLTRLACVRAFDTEVYEHEFFVILQLAGSPEVLESWNRVCDETEGEASPEPDTWPEARRRWLHRGRVVELARHETEIEDLRRQLIDARLEVAEIRHSTSWKITRPLRAAMQRLRG